MSILETIQELSVELLKQNVELISIQLSRNGYDALVYEIDQKKPQKLTIAMPNGLVVVTHD